MVHKTEEKKAMLRSLKRMLWDKISEVKKTNFDEWLYVNNAIWLGIVIILPINHAKYQCKNSINSQIV